MAAKLVALDAKPAQSGDAKSAVAVLLDPPCKTGSTPLHYACANGRLEVTQWLLEHGASLHPRESDGRTPICRARQKGHGDVVEWFEATTLQQVKEASTPAACIAALRRILKQTEAELAQEAARAAKAEAASAAAAAAAAAGGQEECGGDDDNNRGEEQEEEGVEFTFSKDQVVAACRERRRADENETAAASAVVWTREVGAELGTLIKVLNRCQRAELATTRQRRDTLRVFSGY